MNRESLTSYVILYIRNTLWLIPFCSFLGGYLLLNSLYSVSSLTTPSLVGTHISHALTLLSHNNLNPRVLAHKYDLDIMPGTIISQEPRAGTRIKPNQPVFLVIAEQPPAQPAPNFIGQTRAYVQEYIQHHNLKTKCYYIHSLRPENTCIAQLPEPHHPLEYNKPLILYLAKSLHTPLIMPDLRDHDLNIIKEQLDLLEIQAEVTTLPSYKTSYKKQIITDQRPLPGSLVVHTPNKPLTTHLSVST